jgi:transcriptional regulator with XRE-family HTH domain
MPAPIVSVSAGAELRQRRESLGLTRVTLAALSRCSPAQLGAIEVGYSPRRSRVLERARAALDGLDAARQAA